MISVTFKNVNSFFVVTNGRNEIYHFSMNWEEAKKMTDFYNSTIHNEGKFTYQEIDNCHKILIEGINA
jgi:hypothetical protein